MVAAEPAPASWQLGNEEDGTQKKGDISEAFLLTGKTPRPVHVSQVSLRPNTPNGQFYRQIGGINEMLDERFERAFPGLSETKARNAREEMAFSVPDILALSETPNQLKRTRPHRTG
jgi:hypothetical protein